MSPLLRRWFGYLSVAIVFAIACGFLGNWQLHRREEAVQRIERISQNYDAAAIPLRDVVPQRAEFDLTREWQPITVTGEYLLAEQLLVRGRPGPGGVGFEVLTPLRTDAGDVFIVDRGWVPLGDTPGAPAVVPAPPSGTLTVTARLRPSEPVLRGRSAPDGQVATIHLPSIQKLLDTPSYTAAYGLLESESPPAPERPAAAAKPTLDEGPHLSYAFQWFVFAILGFVFLGQAVRRELREVRSDEPKEHARRARRESARARREPDDAAAEDAIIDARR